MRLPCADQALADAVLVGQLAGAVLLANLVRYGDDGSSGLFGQLPRVLLQDRRLFLGELGEILDENVPMVQETFHGQGIAEGQVALEDHAIKTGQNSGDLVLVFLYKGVHGVFLLERLVVQTFWEKKTPFPFLFGCGEAALGSSCRLLFLIFAEARWPGPLCVARGVGASSPPHWKRGVVP